MERRLAAILVADVVGYSRLMGGDEEGTLARLKAHRDEVIHPSIDTHKGRIVKLMGDGLLAEFASVVDAVRCAVDIQEAMSERNADLPEDQRIQLRIGINLGDIIIEGDDIYGDGVNVAARMEGLAEPGGICITRTVVNHVKGKVELEFDDMGDQQVKNIPEPVRVYRIRLGPAAAAIEELALELPDKPSVAVLPFDNLSDDREQAFFADGIAEEIITSLSKVPDLFVIARNSSFAYKGMSPDVRQVAKELGVRYVLEGSVRRAGNRVRITAQLIEALSGYHLWAERYDRELVDIFNLQDEITSEIVTALEVRLTEGEQARLRRRQTDDLGAWEFFVRGQTLLRRHNKEDNPPARALIEQALERDPDFAAASALLAWTHLIDARLGWSTSAKDSLKQGAALCEKSLALDDAQPDAYALLGCMRLIQRRYEEAETYGRKAVELGPNVADAFVWLATTLNYTGRAQEAVGLIEKAMRFSPFYPSWYLGILGVSYRVLGRFEDAIAADMKRLARDPTNTLSNFRLAAVYAGMGREDEARAQVAEALKKNPNASIHQVRISEPYRDEDEMERYLDGLRKAGLPE